MTNIPKDIIPIPLCNSPLTVEPKHALAPGVTSWWAVWPLPNVWLGVSVENQATADVRIPLLLQAPAAKRFISYEPALGPVDFRKWLSHLDLIIVGGESGPGARPFDIEWARSTIKQCREAGVLCFVKQLGARPFHGFSLHKQLHHASADGHLYLHLKDRKGENAKEWPDGLAVQELLA